MLGSISKDLTKAEQREISLNGTVYDFSVDHCSLGYLYDELTLHIQCFRKGARM